MTLKAMIKADSQAVFLNTGEFAENVVYVKHKSVTRPIKAVVIRESIASSDQSGGAITPVFEVHVDNDLVTGISSTEIDLGGDMICFPVRDGMAASDRAIVSVIFQDEAMLVLQCL